MEPSSDHDDDGAVGFGSVSDAGVSAYAKEIVSKVLEKTGNDMRFNGEVTGTGFFDDGSISTNLDGSRLDTKVSEIGELHAINLVVDLSRSSKKEANNVEFTENDLAIASLKPEKIINCVEDLAKDPFWMDPLEASTMEVQLSSFTLWKRDYQLHINEILDESDDKFGDVNSDEVTKESNLNDRSRKHKHVFDNGSSPTKKVKSLSDLVSDLEYRPKNRGRKRKNLEFSGNEFISQIRIIARNPIEIQQNLDSLVRFSSNFKNYRQETKSQMAIQPEVTEENGFTGVKDSIEFSGNEFLSQIRMAAINPIEIQQNLDSLVRFSSDLESYRQQTKSQMVIQPEVTEENGFTGVKDSYRADRITEIKPKKENSPTALILKFTNLESISSLKKLNEIFGRFGALQEEETKVLKKKNCVKMVFERRCDAESAFSSSGKFSIFGPSLVSYCLNFSPTPRKTGTGGRKLKKGVKSVKGMKFKD